MTNLSDRIASVLKSEPAASDVVEIIAEVRDELRDVERQHAAARTTMLDPLAGSAAFGDARREADELSLMRERLTVALEHLERALATARNREENDRRMVAYEAVKARRDAMEAELREAYPRLAGELVGLLERLQAVEAEIETLAYPEGVERFGSVEAEVRGVQPNWCIGLAPISRLTKAVRLPALNGADEVRGDRYWPPRPAVIEFRPVRPASAQVA